MLYRALIVKSSLEILKPVTFNRHQAFNFLIGANGSGKTKTLFEVHLLGHGRSFKSSLTGRIIQIMRSELFVHGRFMTL